MRNWIKQELNKIEESYIAQILNMTGAYHREIERTKEYHGRQLLELLQNADDEAEHIENPTVLIMLEDDRLVIANNGESFSERGILSLMYSDNSPKIKRRKKIGYKGLGFRAILNWSESIWIKSEPFSIEFSRDNAITFLRQLIGKKPSLRQEIDEAAVEKYPIATLAVPEWKESDEFSGSIYDTYVVINFSSPKVKEDIQSQIDELGMEVLLFLNNLTEIKLRSPGRNESIVKYPHKEEGYEEIKLIDQDGEVLDSKKWRIFSRSDELPKDLRKGDSVVQYEYDLRIAVNENLDDKINRLFSFFKTEVKFPFPAIIHGTFDLDGNRNHLNRNEINEFLLEELADLMIETAKQLTQTSENVNWDAVKLLAKKGEFDDKVEKMGFYDKLLTLMKSHELIPVISNKYMSVEEEPVFYDAPFSEILKIAPDVFSDLALYTGDKDVQSLISELGVSEYDSEDFVSKLNEGSPILYTESRAELIVMVAENYKRYFHPISPEKMPNLFVNDKEKIIDSRIQALLPPERSKFKLPNNIEIIFISDRLFESLKRKTISITSRSLASRLSCFNIQEYSFGVVIRKIVTSTRMFIKDESPRATEYVKSMLSSLFSIYCDDTDSKRIFPNIKVPLLNRVGKILNADELYFGKEYFNGKVMNELYSNINGTVFISRKEDLGFENEDEKQIVEFLRWIGVSNFPRTKINKPEDYSEYTDYVLKNLQYPYTTNYYEQYSSYEEFKKAIGFSSVVKVGTIDELDDILSKAEFESILVWLHKDPRLQRIIKDGHESVGSSFNIDIRSKRNLRSLDQSEVRSYIFWKLKTTEWIKTRSGKKVTSDICCLDKNLDGMSPLIEVPGYNIKDNIFKQNNISSDDIDYLLGKIGASRDFSKLHTDTIYEILKRLENADPEGKKAGKIYRQIIQNKPREWAKKVVEDEVRNEFVEEGTMLAKSDGNLAYFPVRDVYYVDNITFCKEIIKKFPIVQIDRRSGKEQIKDIFGVKPLEDIRFKLTSEPKIHHLNIRFQKALESFKPYILVYRLDKSSFNTELNHLKSLKIVLCESISATYQFDDSADELQLNPYEHIQAADDNTVYLLLDPSKVYKDIDNLKKDIKFCDCLAEIITGLLKVGENHKDYRELFPKDRKQRELVIKSDLDDEKLEKLREAKEKYYSISDLEKDFWESVFQAKGYEKVLGEDDAEENFIELLTRELDIDETTLMEIYQGIYYENYSSSSNLRYFGNLFNLLEISVEDFNQFSYERIDFADHFENEITNEKYRLQKKYKSWVYNFLKNKNIEDKQKFVNYIYEYANAECIDQYGINKVLVVHKQRYFDMLFQKHPFKELNLTYSTLVQKDEINLDKKYVENKEEFEKLITETGGAYTEDIESFLDVAENKSLNYFEEYDELIRRFDQKFTRPPITENGIKPGKLPRKKKSISLNGKNEEYDENDYTSLLRNIDEDCEQNVYTIDFHNPARPLDKLSPGTQRAFGGGGGGIQRKQTKEIGLLGEYYVYKELVKKYSSKKVVWVSEYAKIVNNNPHGNDREGYDLRYFDEKDQVHYIEVKATVDNEYSFPISGPEVRYGETNRENYEVILVLNVKNQNREFKNLGNIFNYDEDETFTNNNKFTVENDGFKIRFQ